MGTINYFTSNYITLGARIEDGADYEDDYYNAQEVIDSYKLYYYHVSIKPGYYEGFSVMIENNYPVAYDFYEDRAGANREITLIKKMLADLAGVGLVSCSPGWCTGYEDYNGTMQEINAAIKAMRAEVKTIPTWRQYEAAGF